MHAELLLTILIGIYGVIIGSFLNVCIYRIPDGSTITRKSHCIQCGEAIKWYDLVPLVSYIVIWGRCRYCKARISIQYPLIELVNGIGYAWIAIVVGFNSAGILYCLCFSALLALSVIDWRTYEIPLCFNIFIGSLGIIRLLTDIANWYNYVIGFMSVSGFLLLVIIVTKGRGMGGGDVKLMAAVGLLMGWKVTVLAFVLGCLLGSVIHLIIMRIGNRDNVLAFGPYLSMGVFISMLYGNEVIHWYQSLFIGV